MLKANCPNCGGEIQFKSKTSVLCVCPYCRSNVVRHDANLELLGKQSDLLEDMSPLQIGVTGKYKNKRFHILGRQILGWTDGRWNEWYLMFSDGSDAWLSEAQGEYSLLMKPKVKVNLPTGKDILDLGKLNIGLTNYHRSDFKKVECLGSEGELPFKTIQGSRSSVIDFASENEEFASIEVEATGEVHLYAGEFVTLPGLKVSGIRRFAGWGKP